MSNIEKLGEMLNKEILPEINAIIDNIFELVNSKKATNEDKEALKEVRELKQDFNNILKELENEEIDEDEAFEIIQELIDMREE